MKVIFKDTKGKLPKSMIRLGYFPKVELHLEPGIHYTVYGISSWRNVISYLIIPSDITVPYWYPADLFDVVAADTRVDYGRVVEAMILAQAAGAPSVGLITEPPERVRRP